MVLFLNSQFDDITSDMPMICKMMYNIERNSKIFKLNGDSQCPEVMKESFNTYTYKQITYDISPSYGALVIYKKNISASRIATLLSRTFNDLNLYERSGMSPYSIGANRSTAYTMISKNSIELDGTSTSLFGKNYRKLITNLNDLPRVMNFGSKFIWYIVVCDIDKAHLHPPELSDDYQSEQYLNSALSTVVYDNINMLNVKHGMMQINYPSLKQYTISDKSRIIPDTISISFKMGLLTEIASYYEKNTIEKNTIEKNTIEKNKICLYISLPRYFQNFTIDKVTYDSTQVRRLDLTKPWYNQLNTPWDYKDQEKQEKNIMETGKPAFPNDVCFISQIPLHKTVYLIEVTYNNNRPVSDKNKAIVSCIFVSPYIMHTNIKTKKIRSSIYLRLPEFLDVYGYKITGCSTVEFPRTELTVIQEINNISEEKRNLLHSISKFGSMLVMTDNKVTKYVFNPTTNKIYCGITGTINDKTILKYHNTKTILFRYRILDDFF
jgi:hypothetical protein